MLQLERAVLKFLLKYRRRNL